MYRVRHQTKAIGKAIGRTVMLLLLLAGWGTTEAKRHAKTDDVLNLVASYPALICSTPPDSFTTFSYAKVLINVDRRNLTLATAPTLFYLMHDNRRHFLSESYVRLTYHRDRDDVIEPLLYLSTIYNRHRTLPNLRVYLLPSPYEPTLFAGHILSPLCPENRSFYRYRTRTDEDGTAATVLQKSHTQHPTATPRMGDDREGYGQNPKIPIRGRI